MGLAIPANFGYLLTFTIFFVVFTGFVWRWTGRSWNTRNAAEKSIEELRAYSWSGFEERVAAQFERMGYSVKLTGLQGDHGIDLLAEKPREIAAVQCKNYKAWAVGEPVLRDLLGAMQHYGADKGYVVTTGHLTRTALDWARGKPIVVWDADYLARLSKQVPTPNRIDRHRQGQSARPTSLASLHTERGFDEPSPQPSLSSTAQCPKCGAVLVERANRQTGELFLACPGYPACRHTQPLPIQ